MLKHLPNTLSVVRIPASLALLILFSPQSDSRIWVSIIISLFIMLTDIIDGRIARQVGVTSKLGYLLDGLGDRSFHVVIYLLFLRLNIINLFLAWILIFREICQYAVRLIDADWHVNQPRKDRITTKTYTIVVQLLFFTELLRLAIAPTFLPNSNSIAVSLLLCIIVAASFTRLVPKIIKAWNEAINV